MEADEPKLKKMHFLTGFTATGRQTEDTTQTNDYKKCVDNIKAYHKDLAKVKTRNRLNKRYVKKTTPHQNLKLTDVQAIYCRDQFGKKSVTELARELKVDRKTVDNCVKGLTFKHLNHICPPFL